MTILIHSLDELADMLEAKAQKARATAQKYWLPVELGKFDAYTETAALVRQCEMVKP